MPIVRFSCLGTKLYAPTRDGNLVKQDFAGEAGLLHDISFAQLAAADGPVDRYLAARLPGAAARNPIVIMVNGWGFDPEQPVGAAAAAALASENPHGRIFHWWAHAADQAHDAHAASWPLGLGFAREDDGPGGAAIAFGWDSSDESHAAAYDDGNNAAAALVAVIERMAAADAQLHVNFIGHSLGTHVLCHTLRILATQFQELLPYVGRVVLMGASEYAFEADATYDALREAEAAEPQSCAGLQIYNIANTSDRVTRLAGGLATHGPRGSLHMVCHHGLKSPDPAPRWIDIDLNSAALANRINELFQCVVSGNRPDDFLDHWYYFTHAPNMAFAQALLRGRAGTSIEALKAAGVQTAFGR